MKKIALPLQNSLLMKKTAFVLACLACSSFGRRWRLSDEQLTRGSFSKVPISVKPVDAESMKVLARLLAVRSASAYNPSPLASHSSGGVSAAVLSAKSRFGRQALVMSTEAQEEELIRQAERLEQQASQLRRMAADKLQEQAAALQAQAAQLLDETAAPAPAQAMVTEPEPAVDVRAEPELEQAMVAELDPAQAVVAEPELQQDMQAGSMEPTPVEEDVEEDLSQLTVPVLKERLKAAGLTVGGKKADLIARLQQHAASQTAPKSTEQPAPQSSAPRQTVPETQEDALDEDDAAPPVKIADESWARSTTPGIPEHLKTKPGQPIKQLIAVEGGFIERPPPGPKKLSPEMEELKQVFVHAPKGMLPSEAWKLVKERGEELGVPVGNGIRRDWLRARWEAGN